MRSQSHFQGKKELPHSLNAPRYRDWNNRRFLIK